MRRALFTSLAVAAAVLVPFTWAATPLGHLLGS